MQRAASILALLAAIPCAAAVPTEQHILGVSQTNKHTADVYDVQQQ
jgi:hypothetical protein